jgi:geranylgeranyl reductase family protein
MSVADAEAIVVGGGPAGATMATRLARLGHHVVLLDKSRFPRHKACSEYINPAATDILDELGLGSEIRRLGAHRMDAMMVYAPDGGRFKANFAQVRPGAAALGLSRYRLDHLLLEAARAEGVTIVENAHVRNVVQDGRRITGVEARINGTVQRLHAPLVIGADGINSVVARAAGQTKTMKWPSKTGLIAHFRGVADLDQFGEMYVSGNQSYVGLAPLEDGLTNVAVVVGTTSLAHRMGSVSAFFHETLAAIPNLQPKLEKAVQVGTIRGVGSMAHRSRRICGDGFVLIGDAASFLDPFTGEGIYEALRGAEIAAPLVSDALRAGDTSAQALDSYRVARREAFTAKRTVGWIVQGFINTPPMMNYLTRRLADREQLGLTLAGVLGNLRPAGDALSPLFLARLLRP